MPPDSDDDDATVLDEGSFYKKGIERVLRSVAKAECPTGTPNEEVIRKLLDGVKGTSEQAKEATSSGDELLARESKPHSSAEEPARHLAASGVQPSERVEHHREHHQQEAVNGI